MSGHIPNLIITITIFELLSLRRLSLNTTTPGRTTRLILAYISRLGSISTINSKHGFMDYSALMALPLELSILWQGSGKLVMLMEPLPTTISIMSNAFYHSSMIHHFLKCAFGQNKKIYVLLEIRCQSLGKSLNPLRLHRDAR